MLDKITDIQGNPMVQSLPKVTGVNPVGTNILVELLTPDEIAGPSELYIPKGASTKADGAPQGYVLKVGSKVDQLFGIKEGDRIVLSGAYTPIPEFTGRNNRIIACIEPFTVKAVLAEQ